ncbi:hypothetical protein ACEWY4_003901 [Coilia grayii]|uniref:BEN domain-containing protein n=1 Tax=Coilia grayii TaxID=363190 RepID=A0ABD1KK73_9TELE
MINDLPPIQGHAIHLISDASDRVVDLEHLVAERTLQLQAAADRLQKKDAEIGCLNAEILHLNAETAHLNSELDDLKMELQRLQSPDRGQMNLADEMREMRAGIRDIQAAKREHRSHLTPERPVPRHTSTPHAQHASSSTWEMSPLALSATLNDTIQIPSQHADVTLRDVGPEDHARIHKQNHGQVGRYGCLLFRSIISDEHYRAWSKNTNWDGSRGKRALPQNVKNFVISTLQHKFPAVGSNDLKDCIDKINEYLRITRKNQPHTSPSVI